MASPTSGPSANGTSCPDLVDDVMVDGRRLPQLSIPSPTSRSTVDYKTLDGHWDPSFDSPRSCSSTSTSASFGSPIPSRITRNKSSRAMKPRRNQSAYYDEQLGLWKCRNCGGTYDVPNPGSRQRREHKKACEETQRLKALQQAQLEKARRDELAIRAKGSEEASDHRAVLAGRNPDQLLQNSHGSANKITDDPGVVGALNTTPAIPEKEEVNFGAPKELINNVELEAQESVGAGQIQETQRKEARLHGGEISGQEHGQDGAEQVQTKNETEGVAAGHLQETYWKDAQSHGARIDGQESSHRQAEAEPDQTEHKPLETMEQSCLPSEQNHPAEDKNPGETNGFPSHRQDGAEHDQTKNKTEGVATGHLQETYWKDAQSHGGRIDGQESSHRQAEAEPDQTKHKPMETMEQNYLPSEQNHPAEDKGPGETNGSHLKTEQSEEVELVNDSRTPDSNKVHLSRNLDQHWVDKTSPPPIEQVKYCSSASSSEVRLKGTLYDRLVDLHDDRPVAVTRSVSFSHGVEEASRIASLDHEKEAALGKTFNRALSLDRDAVEMKTRMDHNDRAAKRDGSVAAAANVKDRIRDLSPDGLVEILVGKDHGRPSSLNNEVETQQHISKASSLNGGVEMKLNYGKALVESIGDDRTGHAPKVLARGRTMPYRPQADSSRSEQSGVSGAVATSSRQSQSDTPRKGPSNRNRSASSQPDDDDFGAMVVRNVGKFWKQIASVGAVAVVAWVGKSLANRQERPREKGLRCRRGHCAMSTYYWED